MFLLSVGRGVSRKKHGLVDARGCLASRGRQIVKLKLTRRRHFPDCPLLNIAMPFARTVHPFITHWHHSICAQNEKPSVPKGPQHSGMLQTTELGTDPVSDFLHGTSAQCISFLHFGKYCSVSLCNPQMGTNN